MGALLIMKCFQTTPVRDPIDRWGRLVVVTLSLVALSGCSTTPRPDLSLENQSLPESWSNGLGLEDAPIAPELISIQTWWNQFEDPVLTALVEEALRNNPDLLTALSRVEQARAERGLEKAQLYPSVDGGISGAGSRIRDRDTDTTSSSESYGASIDASWEIDLFGKQSRLIAASEYELEVSKEDYYAAQVSLTAEVANTYLDLLSSRMQLDILNQSVASREDTLQVAEWQEIAGEGDVLNTQQVKVLVEQAKAQIPSYRQSIEEARNALAVLCGTTPALIEDLLSEEQKLPEISNEFTVGIPADVLRQRPDVRSAENQVKASWARLTAVEKTRLPSLTLNGSIGTEAAKASDFFDPQRIFGNLIAGLTAPIWDAGRISRSIEIQQAVLDQSVFGYEGVVLNALAEVENALSRINLKREEIEILERAVEAATLAATLAEFEYEEGEEDILTVLETKRSLLGFAQSLVQSQQDEISAYVQLYKSLGGGWSAIEGPAQAVDESNEDLNHSQS